MYSAYGKLVYNTIDKNEKICYNGGNLIALALRAPREGVALTNQIITA
jgi:hypothetical protein